MTKLKLNGSNNTKFVRNFDYLNVQILNPKEFIPKIESQIIALSIWTPHSLVQFRMPAQGRGNSGHRNLELK